MKNSRLEWRLGRHPADGKAAAGRHLCILSKLSSPPRVGPAAAAYSLMPAACTAWA